MGVGRAGFRCEDGGYNEYRRVMAVVPVWVGERVVRSSKCMGGGGGTVAARMFQESRCNGSKKE